MTERNTVGTCDCPVKGCSQVLDVYQYQAKQGTKVHRFAGRLYCMCPKHGRIETQDYLTENIKWHKQPPAVDLAGDLPSSVSPENPLKHSPTEPTDTLSQWLPNFYQ